MSLGAASFISSTINRRDLRRAGKGWVVGGGERVRRFRSWREIRRGR